MNEINYNLDVCRAGHIHSRANKNLYSGLSKHDFIFEGTPSYFKNADIDKNKLIDEFEVVRYDLAKMHPEIQGEELDEAALSVLRDYANSHNYKSLLQTIEKKEAKLNNEKARQNARTTREDLYAQTDGRIGRWLRSNGCKGLANFMNQNYSGELVRRMGSNTIADWLEGKDSVCKDGKDDGKLSFGEGIWSFTKGLLGGIPKAIINNPVKTLATVGIFAGLTALTSGAILPVLGAFGVTMGVGMVGLGAYKAAKAETDGDAKRAWESMGTGVTTTALSMLASGKMLKAAEKAGVKSAHVSEDANIFQKTLQMFKSVPESIKMSGKWSRFNLNLFAVKEYDSEGRIIRRTFGDDVYKEYDYLNKKQYVIKQHMPNGTYKHFDVYKKGFKVLSEEKTLDGTIKKYEYTGSENNKHYIRLTEETLADGTNKTYYNNGQVEKVTLADGTSKSYYRDGGLQKETFADGSSKEYWSNGKVQKETFADGTSKKYWSNGKVQKETFADGTTKEYWQSNGQLKRETFADGSSKKYNHDGSADRVFADGTQKSYYKNGRISEETFADGSSKTYYENGALRQETFANGKYKKYYENGNLSKETFADGSSKTYYEDGGLKSETLADGFGSEKIYYENGVLKQETTRYKFGTDVRRTYAEDGTLIYTEYIKVETQYSNVPSKLDHSNANTSSSSLSSSRDSSLDYDYMKYFDRSASECSASKYNSLNYKYPDRSASYVVDRSVIYHEEASEIHGQGRDTGWMRDAASSDPHAGMYEIKTYYNDGSTSTRYSYFPD